VVLSNNVEPAGKRGIAEGAVTFLRGWRPDGGNQRFLRIGKLSLRLGERARYGGYEVDEVAELLSFSPRWVRALIKRYYEGGAEALGDQRVHNGTKPTILTVDALTALKRIKRPPDDGGLWTGPKIARWLAQFHGVQAVHD
jgi:hypothetical protein